LEDRNDVGLGVELAANGVGIFQTRGMWGEEMRWSELALGYADDATDIIKSRLLHSFGFAHYHETGTVPVSVEALQRALIHAEAAGRENDLISVRLTAGFHLAMAGRRDEGDRLEALALEGARRLGRPRTIASVLIHRAYTIDPDDLTTKRTMLEEALAIFRVCDPPVANAIVVCLNDLAETELSAGNLGAALRRSEESISSTCDPSYAAWSHVARATCCLFAGDDRLATAANAFGLREIIVTGAQLHLLHALQNAALIALRAGDPALAARLSGYRRAERRRREGLAYPFESLIVDRTLHELAAIGRSVEVERWLVEGEDWDLRSALAAAKTLR